ncbi:MAG: hypothetical protein IH955_03635, partial [Chloroflexi bacterium]|nr:hypothetical protein [Chloroflexota bacterium]
MSPVDKFKLLVVPDDGIGTIKSDGLEAYANELAEEVLIHRDRPATAEELLQRCRDADGVVNILSTSEFTRELMEQCPKL